MAHLWLEDEDAGGWQIALLDKGAYRLGPAGAPGRVQPADVQPADEGVFVLAHAAAGNARWVLLAATRSGARVNGEPVRTGARVLCDRDEIDLPDPDRAADGRYYFSAERLACVVPFPDDTGHAHCPRCKQPLERGQAAVQCPSASCGAWHHQSERLPCWTYHTTCALCNQSTSLEAGYGWTPEQL